VLPRDKKKKAESVHKKRQKGTLAAPKLTLQKTSLGTWVIMEAPEN